MLAPLTILSLLVPVALEHRVATVEAVVRELAQKTGQDLRMRPELKDEVLDVDLRPRPAAEALRLVAEAASAEWSAEDGRILLGRSASLRRRQARAEQAADAAGLARSYAAVVVPGDGTAWRTDDDPIRTWTDATPEETKTDPDAWLRWTAHRMAGTPVGRFLSRALREIPAAELVAIPPGTTVRYVPRPNRLQRALPASSGLSQYLEERRLFLDRFARLSPARREKVARLYVTMDEADADRLPITPLLRVSRDESGTVDVNLTMVGAKGSPIDLEDAQLPVTPDRPGRAIPGYDAWRLRPCPLMGATASFLQGVRGKPVDPAEAKALLDPVAHEPLSALLTGPLNALTAAAGSEAIVALPDECGDEVLETMGSGFTLGDLADRLGRSVAFATDEGVLVGRARRPTFSAAMKTNRALLGGLMRLAAAGEPRLEPTARYALAQNPDAPWTAFERLALWGAGLSRVDLQDGGLFDPPYRDVLRLYASLSSDERSALLAQRLLRLWDLGPASRAILDDLLFRHAANVEGTGRWQTNGLDATLIINGFPPDATLTSSRSRQAPLAITPDGRHRYDGRALGYILEQQEHGEFMDPKQGYPEVANTRFLPGVQSEITLIVQISPDARFQGSLKDVDVDRSKPPVPYGELPAEFLEQFRKTYDFYRKRRDEGG